MSTQKQEDLDNSFLVYDEKPMQKVGGRGKNMYSNDGRDVIIVREVIVVDSGDGDVINSFIALAIVFVGTQIISSVWKRYHTKSFSIVSVSTLLLFPLITAILAKSYLFVSVWAFVAFVHTLAFKDVLLGRRPKVLSTNVYNVYRIVFQISLTLSMLGYIMVAFGFFKGIPWMYRDGIYGLTYMLYFTLIIRTFLDIISERASGTVLPSKAAKTDGKECPMCQKEINPSDKIILECKESFHKDCLRNWKILGKKDICPSCKERIDMSNIEMNPWQKNEYLFTKFLDFTGNLILSYAVIQGIIFFI